MGRIVLQGREDGNCHVTCEVAGDPDDPMTAQPLAMFQPLATDLVRRLEAQTGSTDAGLWVDPPPRPPEPKELIKSKLMQCERCDAGVALLIFADRATDHGGLEDYARKMYPRVVQLNLPTYVMGPPLGGGPLPERPADILKIWPNRKPIRQLRPAEFNPIIQELARAHCR